MSTIFLERDAKMRYVEVSIGGIFVAPFVLMMLGAWLITVPLRYLGDRIGIARYVWHPALFDIAVYVIVLSLVVLCARWR
jgi:protein AaeX